MSGFVHLVGAGPGDPKLLTLRALELLERAEVVAYDELVSSEILALASPGAELLAVGRRAGQGETHYRLHPAVLERARAGRVVVRLKSGDPFIFGRGGEEAEVLAEAGIPFEVVPGVSAALGAAAAFHIPLTHRRVASRVTFITGHEAEEAGHRAGETLVIYMGARRLAQNLGKLIASGWDPETPAAYVSAATTRAQDIIVGTISDLSDRAAGMDPQVPALLVIGEVVSLRARLLELRPLSGRRVLVARARPRPSEIAHRLRGLGADVLEAPEVATARLAERSKLIGALARLDRYGALVFACAPAVDAVLELDPLRGRRIVSVGVDASRALAARGLEPTLRIAGACKDALSAIRGLSAQGPLLLVTAEGGRPHLEEELVILGARTEVVPAYRYVYHLTPPTSALVDLVVLPSSSSARLVLTSAWGEQLSNVPMVAMGPRSREAAEAAGARRVRTAREDTIDALVDAAVEAMNPRPVERAGRRQELDRRELLAAEGP